MKLVYKDTGIEVKVGDRVILDGATYRITHFAKPHKPSSSGKVCVQKSGTDGFGSEYYVSVINAMWIDREDQMQEPMHWR